MSDQTTSQAPLPRHKKSRTKLKIVMAAAAALLVVVVVIIPAPQAAVEVIKSPAVNVTTLNVTPVTHLADTFILPAVVEPNRTVTIAAEINGRVERLAARQGDTVHADELLIELNTDLLTPQLEQARAQLQRHQTEYERMSDLVQRQATSRSDLDDAAMDRAVSQATVTEIQARLQRSRITAPCTGVLNDLDVEAGEYVQPGTPVARIVEIQTVKVVVDIPERDIGYFSVSQCAQVLVTTKGQTLNRPGRITYISALADEQTRSTRVEITLDNQDGALHSGQVVRVQLTRRVLPEAIMLPLLAVIPMEDSKIVYVVKDNITERRNVELGLIRGDQVQITSGLTAGDQVIVAGHRFVAPGQQVNVVDNQQPTTNNE